MATPTITIKKVFVNEKNEVVHVCKALPTVKKSIGGSGHWEFPVEPGSEEYFGFVYAIFDPETRRGYIGKKQYRGSGKLNKGKESDWRRYTSSCKELVEAIRQRGIQNFRFIILEQYKVRGTLTYAETWTQCHVETPTSPNWYNTRIEEVSWNVKEMITDRHKERLKMVMEMVGKDG